ncbi:hypothetical protein L7F22_046527 [Adiantum nelumboides]|nr:hypothetical protein [Adiantum nelumboides]
MTVNNAYAKCTPSQPQGDQARLVYGVPTNPKRDSAHGALPHGRISLTLDSRHAVLADRTDGTTPGEHEKSIRKQCRKKKRQKKKKRTTSSPPKSAKYGDESPLAGKPHSPASGPPSSLSQSTRTSMQRQTFLTAGKLCLPVSCHSPSLAQALLSG